MDRDSGFLLPYQICDLDPSALLVVADGGRDTESAEIDSLHPMPRTNHWTKPVLVGRVHLFIIILVFFKHLEVI